MNTKQRSESVAVVPVNNEEERLEKLATILNAAGNGAAPPVDPDVYGQRYAKLRADIIHDGEESAKVYQHLAEEYRNMAKDYEAMANKIKAAAVKSADNLIRDRVRVDKALALINEDISEVTQ